MFLEKKIKRIGLFDSGVGGLTVLKELLKLPVHEYIYVADTFHMPYGQKRPDQILQYSQSITNFLLNQRIDALVVACHTSSAIALSSLQKKFPDLLIIGTIHETMLHVVQQTNNNRIGILATQASINSHIHKKELLAIDSHLEIFEMACPDLVPLIEAAENDTKKLNSALHEYLEPLIEQNVDTIILGCTHYPLLEKEIKEIVGKDIKLVSSEKVIAQVLQKNLEMNNKFENFDITKKFKFYSTGDHEEFQNKANIIMGQNIIAQHLALDSYDNISISFEFIQKF